MASSWSGFTAIRALAASIPNLSCDTLKASVSGVVTVLSGTTLKYTNIHGTTIVLSNPTVASLSIIEAVNIKQAYVVLATGDDSYTITGIAATDVILDCIYQRTSTAGVVITVGAATTNVTSATNVSISAVVSAGVGLIRWLDISA